MLLPLPLFEHPKVVPIYLFPSSSHLFLLRAELSLFTPCLPVHLFSLSLSKFCLGKFLSFPPPSPPPQRRICLLWEEETACLFFFGRGVRELAIYPRKIRRGEGGEAQTFPICVAAEQVGPFIPSHKNKKKKKKRRQHSVSLIKKNLFSSPPPPLQSFNLLQRYQSPRCSFLLSRLIPPSLTSTHQYPSLQGGGGGGGGGGGQV